MSGRDARARRRAAPLLAALAALACADASPVLETRRRVLLVTVDTLRWDYLSRAGYDRPTTPFVDALLEQGVVFERTLSPMPRTTPALASLLTGAYPHAHGVRALFERLPEDVPTLPALLRARGYRTLAVVSNHLLTAERGLGRGFELYDFAPDARDARATTRAALAHLAGRDPDEPLFAWVHYIDPHVPYYPPPALARAFDPAYEGRYALHFGDEPGGIGDRAYPRDLPKREAVYRNPLPDAVNAHIRRLYAADVRATDDAIAELVEGARAALGADWLVVFTSDHGEDLGEHGIHYDHGETVYDPAVRVPLAFVLPAADPLHRRASVRDWVSLVDVAPTLAELLGAPPPDPPWEGRSLVPLLAGEPLPPRPAFAESGTSFFPDLARQRVRFDVAGRLRAVVDGDWKLIWTPGRDGAAAFELYDLGADPGERRDLYSPEHPAARRLEGLLRAWQRADDTAPRAPSAEDLERLRSLGYVE